MEDFLIITLAAFCTGLPLWMGRRYGMVSVVSPMHLLAYFAGFGFLIKVAVYSTVPEWAFYTRFVTTPGAQMVGALYLAGFILLLCLGYRCAVRPVHTQPHIADAQLIAVGLVRQGWLFVAAFAVAAVTIMLLIRARGADAVSLDVLTQLNTAKQINLNSNGVGATLAGIKTLFVVPKFAFVLLLGQGLVLRRRYLLLQAALLAALVVLIALISGDRFELVELLVFAIATFTILGGRIGARAVLCIGIAAIGVLLTSAYMTALRGQNTGLMYQIVGSTYFLDINAAVMVTDRVTPSMYLLGESYGWWSFGWVPRAIWLDKPAIDLGVFFKRDVMGVDTGGAFNVTGPGEAYINFGWAGMAVGFALGWLCRKGEVLLLASPMVRRHGAFWFYPLLLYPFVQATLQSSFSAFVVGAVAQAMILALMLALFVPRFHSAGLVHENWRYGHAV
ncbi:oligosaccharide repeat unit polymerase [Loktanella sp. Alg231-35]|uniref:oligosaccharide repeat unit polymerase n=1 Tax=Loktanella sp. Alg231-35 TaxID=1922220 RepID=UPI001F43D187|nr:oligosaccharide repeat unit polymerase [Loktanella sp. Alg231-35]